MRREKLRAGWRGTLRLSALCVQAVEEVVRAEHTSGKN
jgi:hypothetical protein